MARAGTPERRRTVVGIDIGLGARHRRGSRVATGPAPLRETMAAQLIMLSRWDARSEVLVDPMAGGGTIPIEAAGLAVGAAIRQPPDLPFRHLAAFDGLPMEAPNLFPGTVPRILALDVDVERIPAMVGNLRAAGLTGPSQENSIVIGQLDVRALTPDYVAGALPRARDMNAGVFCFNPPYGVRIGGEAGEEKLLELYADMGRVLARFRGWRAACFVANARFVGLWTLSHDETGHHAGCPALFFSTSCGVVSDPFLHSITQPYSLHRVINWITPLLDNAQRYPPFLGSSSSPRNVSSRL